MNSPQWSSRSIPALAPVDTEDASPDPTKRTGALLGLGALLLLAAGYLILRDSGPASELTQTGATATPTTSSTMSPTTSEEGATPTTPDQGTTTSETAKQESEEQEDDEQENEAEESTAEEPDESASARLEDPTRRAIMSGGIIYLRGSVPSQDIADEIQTKAAAVLGSERVVVEYVIDPGVELSQSAPLIVEDVVLFEFGSASINPQFFPLLDLGSTLMQQNPGVLITVTGHTDSVSSAAFNQRLSEERTAAVLQYWLDNGVASNQFEGVSMGETQPVADESLPNGAQSNRRVEFIISGLLD